MQPVGLAPLQAKISHHMVPTLVESFGLTVAIIFGTFLLVFRSGIARLMAVNVIHFLEIVQIEHDDGEFVLFLDGTVEFLGREPEEMPAVPDPRQFVI